MSLRPVLRATLCGALLVFSAPSASYAQQRPAVTGFSSGVPSGPGGADPVMFRYPPLDPVTLVMAYHRLTGTSIDFRPYAEKSAAYQNATAFDRPDVLTREIARLEGQFASLDLSRVYVMRLGTLLKQFDATEQGYPLDLGPDTYIPISDPVTYKGYGLQLRNIEEVTFIPIGDATTARMFAQKYGLNMQSATAGSVIAEFAFRLTEAPPALSNGPTMIRADILATRILNHNGQPMWDFGQTITGREPVSQAAAPGSTPMLKAADVQGIRLGMPVAEGAGIASREYQSKLDISEKGGRWFRNIAPEAEASAAKNRTSVRCGLAPLSPMDTVTRLRAGRSSEVFTSDESEACIGLDAAPGSAVVSQNIIGWITSGQRLDGANIEAVGRALIQKYGTPTYTQNGGRVLQWIGRDPARADGGPVSITARIDARREGGVLLGIEAKPYVDPNAQRPTAPAAAAAPRL